FFTFFFSVSLAPPLSHASSLSLSPPSSPPQFVVTTTVPNLTDLVSVISIFITTKPCHHQTSSSSPPQFIVVTTTALRVCFIYLGQSSYRLPLNKVEEAEEAWWWWSRTDSISEEAWLETRRQRAGDSRTEHNSCSVFSVVMRRQHSGG
uniref:Uncharacterized protein n=1 Tax=Brassica oleracea var. oleracea TaxID=109376 RepID=A0A0D3DSC4_BRAOL